MLFKEFKCREYLLLEVCLQKDTITLDIKNFLKGHEKGNVGECVL